MATRSPAILAVVNSFRAHAEQWQHVVDSLHPLQECFPAVLINGKLTAMSNFTKVCLIKALVPGKFVTAVRELVALEQGEVYLNPPLFDIERSFEDSTSATPLIFILPGADPL
jgi:dynein heavy chain